MTASTITAEERYRQVALFRRKADKVRSKGMAVSVDGVMMRAVLAEIDHHRARDTPDDPRVAQRHADELARVCADHRTELDAMRSERDRAIIERDAAKDVAAAAVAAARNGDEPVEPKSRAPRTKEEPWRSITLAANDILTGGGGDAFMDLWGEDLVTALPEWGAATGTDVRPWLAVLSAALPTPVPASVPPKPAAKSRKAAARR